MAGFVRTSLTRAIALLALALLLGLSTRAVLVALRAGAEVSWPSSSGLVIGELVTRGAAASDQYAELYNASDAPFELGGFELDYVTASGATTTVKQSWSALVLPVGAHLLVANAAGSYASIADGTFSGGFSTAGGTLVVRNTGTDSVIDALSWGSALNEYVEGATGPAPPTGSSLERLPGAGSNWVDTNDNAADTIVQPVPIAQNLASPPQPAPTPSPSATAPACATAPPTDEPTEVPTDTPAGTPTVTPPATPTPAPSPTPPATLTPLPTTTPTATPTPAPVVSIAEARVQPIGATVVVGGTVTVGPGLILGHTTLALEDDSGGIYAKLPSASASDVAPGDIVQVAGVLAAPYGNLQVDINPNGMAVIGHSDEVAPRNLEVGEFGEATEGLLARVDGTVDSISASSSGSVTVMLTDASGVGRVFVYDTLGLGAADFVRGEELSVTGLVGDRLGLYRLWPRSSADIVHLGEPAPSPTPRTSATPEPTSASEAISIGAALLRAGQTVTVEGTVSVRTGLLDSDGTRVTIQDDTGAILVRLPNNDSTAVGDRIRVSGAVGTYYGAPQLTADRLTGLSSVSLTPLVVRSAPLSAALEWRLVTVSGEISSVSRDGDTWRAELTLAGGSLPVSGLSRSGIAASAVEEGRHATITGLVKRAYPTATDQRFALVPRGPTDITLGAAGTTSGSAGPSLAPPTTRLTSSAAWPTPSAGTGSGDGNGVGGPSASSVALGELPDHLGETVAVGGRVVVVNSASITISDGGGVVMVLLSGSALDQVPSFSPGDLLNAIGIVVEGADGSPAIAVSDARALTRLAQVGATRPLPTPKPSPSAYWPTVPGAATVGAQSSTGPLGPMLLVVLLLAGLGLLATAHPRVRAAIRARAAGIHARLAGARAKVSKRSAG